MWRDWGGPGGREVKLRRREVPPYLSKRDLTFDASRDLDNRLACHYPCSSVLILRNGLDQRVRLPRCRPARTRKLICLSGSNTQLRSSDDGSCQLALAPRV